MWACSSIEVQHPMGPRGNGDPLIRYLQTKPGLDFERKSWQRERHLTPSLHHRLNNRILLPGQGSSSGRGSVRQALGRPTARARAIHTPPHTTTTTSTPHYTTSTRLHTPLHTHRRARQPIQFGTGCYDFPVEPLSLLLVPWLPALWYNRKLFKAITPYRQHWKCTRPRR